MKIDQATWTRAQAKELAFWQQGLQDHKTAEPDRIRLMASYTSCLIWGRFGYFPTAFDGKTVIDIGCGPTGRCSCFMEAKLIGVDPLAGEYSEFLGNRMVSYDGWYPEPAEDHCAAFDNYADMVVSLNCLDHCRDAKAVIENMVAYMKPGASGLLSTDVDMGFGHVDPLHPLRLLPGTIAGLLRDTGVEITLHERGRSYPVVGEDGRIAWQDGWCGGKYVAHHWHLRKAG